MGIFDWLTGNKAANPNVRRLSAAELKQALLALNSDERPWAVHDASEDAPGIVTDALVGSGITHHPDLVADWKFTDEKWRQQLTDDQMSAGFRMLLRLDDANSTVRSVDHQVDTTVAPGSVSITATRGQKVWSGGSISFDRNAEGKWVKTGQSSMSTDTMKTPLRQLVADSGWAWHGVTIGKF